MDVEIPISKTQIAVDGQPLNRDQLIQLSVYVPKEDGKGLTQKVNVYARVASQNETSVILSVPAGQATTLEEALLNENSKVIYHKVGKIPEPSAATKTPATTTVPTPATGAVQLQVPVQAVHGGIASLRPEMKVRFVIVEKVAVYSIDKEPVATVEPAAPVGTCASLKGFMLNDTPGLVDKEDADPAFVLLEIDTDIASEIARALTNASAVYLLPVNSCR